VIDHRKLLARFAPKYGADLTVQELKRFLRCMRCERKDRLKTFELTLMEQ
jgi:hypothetical protein